jgi:hypothetical protein
MDGVALLLSIASLLVSGGLSAVALVYAHRADRRARSAERAAARAEERELVSFRVAGLQRMLDSVHEIAHASWEGLGSGIVLGSERHSTLRTYRYRSASVSRRGLALSTPRTPTL